MKLGPVQAAIALDFPVSLLQTVAVLFLMAVTVIVSLAAFIALALALIARLVDALERPPETANADSEPQDDYLPSDGSKVSH